MTDHTEGKNQRAALVVGGGLAGMQASLLLAAVGVRVYLVDRAPAIGGHQPLLDRTFPTDSCGLCFMSPRPAAYCPFVECERDDRVSILTSTQVAGLSGSAGDFSVRLLRKARGVDAARCTGCGRCAGVCPIQLHSELGDGVEERKAIYRPFAQAVPDSYLIDWSSCTRCGRCVDACPEGAIDLQQGDTEETVHVGAVILTPGFRAVDGGLKTEYGYGLYPNVLTSIQLERMLSYTGPTGGRALRPSDGRSPEKVAFIQCVGSRDPSCGREYCSSICCMYAAKQATLLTERDEGASAVLFQMDLRAFGKGYDSYVRRVREEQRVEYRRSAVSTVKQVPGSRDLLVGFVDAQGVKREEPFSLVVLSVGVEPSEGVAELASILGVPRNRHGFLESDPLFHEQSPVAGVFVAGGGREPMDVADSVAEAAAAAAAAAGLLGVRVGGKGNQVDGDGRAAGDKPLPYDATGTAGEGEAPAGEGSMPRGETGTASEAGMAVQGAAAAEDEPESRLEETAEAPRVGVLLCDCGGEIGRGIDLPALVERIASWPEVGGATVVDALCGPAAGGLLREALRRHGANRLVVAACARRKIEGPLANAAREAGLDPQLLELVNLREQGAWVHPEGGAALAAKAETLLAMAVARVAGTEALPELRTGLPATALVAGGGVAGMVAAATLAGHGVEVWLVERRDQLGGALHSPAGAQEERGSRAQPLAGVNMPEGVFAGMSPVHPSEGGSRAQRLAGSGVSPETQPLPLSLPGDAAEGSEGESLLLHLLGQMERSDHLHLLTGAEVVRVDGRLGAFRSTILAGQEKRVLDHSVVLLATGVEESLPGEYLLGEHPAVLTLAQLRRKLAGDPGWVSGLRGLALLLCAGSLEPGHDYCSRTCCSEAVEAALRVKRQNPEAAVYVLHREMRSYGFSEVQYEAARRAGVLFLRYEADRKPRVSSAGDGLNLTVDEPRMGRAVDIQVDALALAVGVAPNGNQGLRGSLGVEVDEHGFFVEANVKARSTEAKRPGVYLCGTCQSPRSLADTVVHARAAAMRALALLSTGEVVASGTRPVVNRRICSGCGLCIETCAYGARVLDPEKNVSVLIEALCQGCGACAAVCPNGATQQGGFGGRQMVAVLDVALD